MTVHNVQTMPALAKMSLGRVFLEHTAHAKRAAFERGLELPNSILVSPGTIVEVEAEGRILTKVVIRVPYDEFHDQVFALVPATGRNMWWVKTTWFNRVDDQHATLNLERIAG